MTPHEFVQTFTAAMHNPYAYGAGFNDIRVLNPQGYYLKHINLIVTGLMPEGYPDRNYIMLNHPDWIVKDRNGHPITLFVKGNYLLDFASDAYLDWVLNTWLPTSYFDRVDKNPTYTTWLLQDNGVFYALTRNCAVADSTCNRYATDANVQKAWIHFLTRLKTRWPRARIAINTGPEPYRADVQSQFDVMTKILASSDGYYGESLVDRHAYWSNTPPNNRRIVLRTTLLLARWLADNDKIFFPNFGIADGQTPTQAEMDYAWAFFNLMRRGNKQFFSRKTNLPGYPNEWQPSMYPEMMLPLGLPLEDVQEFAPNVFRRQFERAIAYVNISDKPITIELPVGDTYQNSVGQIVKSPLVLPGFDGLTVYKALPSRAQPR